MMRRLLETHRLIPLDRLDEYLEAWARVRGAVAEHGGNAWLFRGAARQDHYLEFIEWQDLEGEPPLTEMDDVAAARAGLDESFETTQVEEWEEAT